MAAVFLNRTCLFDFNRFCLNECVGIFIKCNGYGVTLFNKENIHTLGSGNVIIFAVDLEIKYRIAVVNGCFNISYLTCDSGCAAC